MGAYRQKFTWLAKLFSLSLEKSILVGAVFILFLWECGLFVKVSENCIVFPSRQVIFFRDTRFYSSSR